MKTSNEEFVMKLSGRIAPLVAAALALTVLACGGDASDGANPETSGVGSEAPAQDPPVGTETEPGSSGASEAAAALLDPNEATRSELLGLPAFDEALADSLVSGRPYEDMEEVDAVLAERLDASSREEVYRRLFKPLDLNSATEGEVRLIPGVGERMAHEFEEYRPYRGIEEFRREIGKYVDDAEVARLERYVRISSAP